MAGIFGDDGENGLAFLEPPERELPAGVYKTIIVDTKIGILSNSNGRGSKITITNMVVSGPYTGTKFQKIHSFGHTKNENAKKMARRDLATIAKIVCVDETNFDFKKTHAQLRGKPILVEISKCGPVPAKDYPHSEPTAYFPWDPNGVIKHIICQLEQLTEQTKKQME